MISSCHLIANNFLLTVSLAEYYQVNNTQMLKIFVARKFCWLSRRLRGITSNNIHILTDFLVTKFSNFLNTGWFQKFRAATWESLKWIHFLKNYLVHSKKCLYFFHVDQARTKCTHFQYKHLIQLAVLQHLWLNHFWLSSYTMLSNGFRHLQWELLD